MRRNCATTSSATMTRRTSVSATSRCIQANLRDGIERPAATQNGDGVPRRELGHAVARGVRRRADVGKEHAARRCEQLGRNAGLVFVHIKPRGADLPGDKSTRQGGGVDETPSSGVDENGVVPHAAKLLL